MRPSTIGRIAAAVVAVPIAAVVAFLLTFDLNVNMEILVLNSAIQGFAVGVHLVLGHRLEQGCHLLSGQAV